MDHVALFMGKPLDYWLELRARFAEGAAPQAEALLEEVIKLRGKVSFYEDRIRQMREVMG